MRPSLRIFQLSLLLAPLVGCDRTPQAALRKGYTPSPDQDVTTSATYNFAPFAGTVWKTRVKTAVADIERYTGAMDTKLLAPLHFDPTDPNYTPIKDLKITAEMPPGTRLRITRLMKDQGVGGNVQVEAVVQNGANSDRTVFLDGALLSNPRGGAGPNLIWGANPDMLEKAQ